MELTSESDFVQCRVCGGPVVPALEHPGVVDFAHNDAEHLRCLACNFSQPAGEEDFDKTDRLAAQMTKEEMRAAGQWWRKKRREERAKLERLKQGRW